LKGRKRAYLGALVALGAVAGAASMGALSSASAHTAARAAAPAASLDIATGTHRAHVMGRPTSIAANMNNGPLLYNGGPVIVSTAANKVTNYLVWWNPGHLQNGAATSYSAKYKSLAQQWIKDQPQSPVYSNNDQYYQVVGGTTTYIQDYVSAPKVITDKDPFPVGQCNHFHTGTNCITDANIQAELQHLKTTKALPANLNTEYFVMTPAGEGSCFDSGCGYPSYGYYCAYHTYFTPSGGGAMIYATMPYPTDPGGSNCYGVAGQTYPNGDVNADANINLMSHEQMESVTDPLLNAWKDQTGNGGEIGDVCAWQFGPNFPSGGDLQISGHPYSVQQEGDNHNLAAGGTGCVMAGP
jgi:hypothetical protein